MEQPLDRKPISPAPSSISGQAAEKVSGVLFLVRHIGMRPVSTEQLLRAIPEQQRPGDGARVDFEVNTERFAEEVDASNWAASHGEVWSRANDLRDLLSKTPSSRIVYGGGMPEVAHA